MKAEARGRDRPRWPRPQGRPLPTLSPHIPSRWGPGPRGLSDHIFCIRARIFDRPSTLNGYKGESSNVDTRELHFNKCMVPSTDSRNVECKHIHLVCTLPRNLRVGLCKFDCSGLHSFLFIDERTWCSVVIIWMYFRSSTFGKLHYEKWAYSDGYHILSL